MAIRRPATDGPLVIWGFLFVNLLKILVDRKWPGSAGATVMEYLFFGFFLIWIGFKIRVGYRRRRPYWTRESWLRFLRLTAMPVAALIVLFLLLSFVDMKASHFGSPRSVTRVVWITITVTLMLFAAIGLASAVDWMGSGDPSEQFTRTRWFRRRGTSAIAD